jgi:homoserine dehydrogenase
MKVALLGCGVVGAQVLRLLSLNADDLTARVGEPLEVVGVAVRRAGLERDAPVAASLFTTDVDELVSRPDVDIVVEVVGGIEPARSWLLTALGRGASVVSANKALLATHGRELRAAAAASGADLYYEAAVAGAIPLLRPLRESLAGDRVRAVLGIVNGTTNYILTKMDETGASFADALAEATELGFAEADPSADIDGYDAAAKAAIIAQLAFHTEVELADVHREGIADVTATDIAAARATGCVVKALAIAELADDRPGINVRVHPAMIPRSHPLATVREAFNAVFVDAEAAGDLMFYGRGAGGAPTASAVLGDLVAVARNRRAGQRGPVEKAYANLPVLPIGRTVTRYHVNLDVTDKAGVLAAVAGAFARHDVSINSVRQDGRGDDAQLVLVTHAATDAALSATVAELRGLDAVRAVAGVMRVEGGEP